ncbi:MAG: hypothetical protein EAX90_15120 [Candidatus Heimdallarchaeota archaeon]|nr:hypothetical protein [Candidatus Heimdallarchaeota archaeon]
MIGFEEIFLVIQNPGPRPFIDTLMGFSLALFFFLFSIPIFVFILYMTGYPLRKHANFKRTRLLYFSFALTISILFIAVYIYWLVWVILSGGIDIYDFFPIVPVFLFFFVLLGFFLKYYSFLKQLKETSIEPS